MSSAAPNRLFFTSDEDQAPLRDLPGQLSPEEQACQLDHLIQLTEASGRYAKSQGLNEEILKQLLASEPCDYASS